MKKKYIAVTALLIAAALTGCVKHESVVDTLAQGANDFYDQAIVGQEGEVFTVTESSLQQVLETSELSALEYTYNSIKKAYNEKGKLKYAVYYSGKVRAGIDFKDIEISVDDDNKIVHIKVPDATIQSCDIDDGSLDFIFEKEKDDTIEVHNDALKLVKTDLEEKAEKNEDILKLAKDNSDNIVEQLLKPWIEYAGYSYTIE